MAPQLPPFRCGNSSLSQGEGQVRLLPLPLALPRFPVWHMQSGLIVCGGDPGLCLDPAETLSISPTHVLHAHWEGAPVLAPETILMKETVLIKHGLMSATWEREAGSGCPFSPLLCGFFQAQTGSSLLPASRGPHIWAGERSERKGRDPLEKDHSSWDGEGGSSRAAGQCAARQSEPSRG